VAPAVAVCGNPAFGDYQCNNAMPLFQRLKAAGGAGAASPRAVAEKLLAALPASPMVAATSIAGPGFINVTLSRPWLAQRLGGLLTHGAGSLAPPVPGGRRRAVVDFSSPNIAKEMHVGHLRSTILGDTLCRCLEFSGAEVLRLNHVGDWGTQFGMLIEHLADQPGGAEGASIGDLQAFYKASKKRFDDDAAFKARAQAAVVRLQAGSPEARAAWSRICAVSRAEFDALYARLGVTLTERGESFYNELIPARLEELASKGVSTVSEGAQCVFTPGNATPLIVRKSDGGFNYASTDLAALWHRVHTERADWLVYVTDSGQSGHFAQVFEAGRAAGWLPADGSVRVDHVGFGLVMGDDGKRFRTRSSDTVRLADLLDEARERCLAQMRERGGREDLSEEELQVAAEAMGYSAVKYADLNQNRATNYTFSFDRMLDLKGNTAVYLLYAHARINSIVRKAGVEPAAAGAAIALVAPEEAALGLAISRFPEAVEATVAELMPNRLTDYLYDLSAKFNEFYGACTVIGSEQQASRLQLCEATAVVMRKCFDLLGITYAPLMRL
jgi:arginyl-tRNA synthetase